MKSGLIKTNFTFFLFLIISGCILPQSTNPTSNKQQIGLPVIRNYLPKDYKAHNQNWAIVEDHRGKLYFGNSSGVLEFDGNRWNLIPVTNSLVRSLAVDNNGTIFVGSADDFGYLERHNNGSLVYKSLLSFLNINEPIGHVWYTFNHKGSIIFITDRFIFSFAFHDNSYSSSKIKTWVAEQRFRIAHKVNNDIYVLELAKGLLKFDGEKFNLISGSELFISNTIYSMLPFNDDGSEILIATRSIGLFVYDGNKFRQFKTDADPFIKTNNLYLPGTKLTDGTFALNTYDAGVVIIDSAGSVVRKINMETGIPDDGVLFTLQSKGKLWLALQNGISSIDIPSAVSYLNQNSGLKGSVSDVKIINNKIYAATTAGVFRLDINDSGSANPVFEEISNINNEAWWIINFNNSVIAAITNGILVLGEKKHIKLNSKWRSSYFIYRSTRFPNRLYVGLENGLAVLDKKNNVWIDRGKIEGINTAIRNIAEDNDGNLWLGTTYNGVYKLSDLADDLSTQPSVKHYLEGYFKPGEEVKLFKIKSSLLFTTKTKVLVFDESKQSFEPEENVGFNSHLKGAETLYILEDQSGGLWVSAIKPNSELTIASASLTNGKYEWKELSFLKSVIDFSNSNAVFTIFKDETTGVVWFCGADGIVSYNTRLQRDDNYQDAEFKSMITRVIIHGDSLLFLGDDLTKSLLLARPGFKLSHNFSSLRFEFSSLTYDGELSQYQYELDGLDSDWSSWTSENKKDYTNLPAGEYMFRLRAKDIFNRISKESSFSFSVLSPWYLSWYAYVAYIFLLGFIIYSIVKVRLNYLTQRNTKLESIIADRTRTINQQNEKLQALDEIKSRFFTNISHEFRTPLTLTLGQIESVMQSVNESGLKKKLEMGYQNAKKLLRLINQLLEISKIESGNQQLSLTKKNIVSFVRHILYNFESVADQKGISLEFNSSDKNISLYFDSEKLDKVFTNLIANSIKFTPEGGNIIVKITTAKELSLEENETVEVTITDTGIGIPKERLAHIFDRFYQADRSDRSESEGTGIGLTLVKELVELHSGKIEVESEQGKGSSFKVTFPAGKDHLRDDEVSETLIDKNYESEDMTVLIDKPDIETDDDRKLIPEKESVLVIDDNSDIRQFIREQLEDTYSILEAKDGVDGLNLALEVIPNLIITDVRMPGIDGFELSRKFKEETLTSHIPVIILTAKADQKDKLSGLETGADDYLIKPFSPQELILRVRNLISVRKKLRERYSKTANFSPSDVTESSLDQKFLSKVLEEIHNNISDEKFNAEFLAKNSAISVSQLNRKLNALIGQPAGHFIRSLRMEKAAQMLKNKEASIKEVAYSVGYTDQSNFARSFKKHFGKTPGEFLSI